MMGSGGMVSTPGDYHQWQKAILAGQVLSDEAQKHYWPKGFVSGGSDRGFLFYAGNNPNHTFILSSNSHTGADESQANGIAKALMALLASD